MQVAPSLHGSQGRVEHLAALLTALNYLFDHLCKGQHGHINQFPANPAKSALLVPPAAQQGLAEGQDKLLELLVARVSQGEWPGSLRTGLHTKAFSLQGMLILGGHWPDLQLRG